MQAHKAKSAAEWRDLARKVEDLGFSTLFVADHYLGRGPASREVSQPPQHLAPIAAMAFQAVDGRSPEQQAVDRLDIIRNAAGDRFGDLDIECSPYFAEITDDADAAVARVAEFMKVPPDVLLDHPNVLIGSADEIADRLRARRETQGVNYVSIQQAQVDSFAPIAAKLAGQ